MKAILLTAFACLAAPAASIDTSLLWSSGGCFFRFIDQDGNAAVAGDCNGVPIGTPVNAITVGFNPYVAEPSDRPNLSTPPPVIIPPITPGGSGDSGGMKGTGGDGGNSTPVPEPNYAITIVLGLITASMRSRIPSHSVSSRSH